eukprot:CAMPEP_0172007372 /NCGR_PEP_ID=MMETSP1041-20130122/6055_1 /TAXON_ID=464988 /ORGANISM="Hemiselmis andersenii, Strain CCMP439" /LENGTH=32 /DNA_ID= /DNA_START= /DNA_END= /DNA_ORIENTATION=
MTAVTNVMKPGGSGLAKGLRNNMEHFVQLPTM